MGFFIRKYGIEVSHMKGMLQQTFLMISLISDLVLASTVMMYILLLLLSYLFLFFRYL